MKIYKIGYKVNDPYTTYLSLGKPNQLTRQQVNFIKETNDGSPVSYDVIQVNSSGSFIKEFAMRENDVFLLDLVKP